VPTWEHAATTVLARADDADDADDWAAWPPPHPASAASKVRAHMKRDGFRINIPVTRRRARTHVPVRRGRDLIYPIVLRSNIGVLR